MESRHILITGCSSGIGRACAILFADNDWKVFATVRKSSDAESLKDIGKSNIIPVFMDVNDQSSIDSLFKKVQEAVSDKGLDALINNASISISLPLEYANEAHIRSHFDTNVIGTLNVTRTFLPLLKKAKGRILNISSGAGVISTPLMGVYSASKFAIEALSDAFRPELRKSGVSVILLEPGFIDTEIHDKSEHHYQKLQDCLGEEAWSYYGPSLVQGAKTNASLRKKAPKAKDAADVVFHAINSNKPRARYTVGKDARLMRLLAPFLTSRLRDKMWQVIFRL